MNGELVSVLVLSYRCSKTVIDTLNSIYSQTYQNLELVVTDDGSDDSTLAVISAWIDKNKQRFVKTILVTTEVNTGTSKNLNRGIKACNGNWIKTIDADDLLLPECVEHYMEQVQKDKGFIKIYQSDEDIINEKGETTGSMVNEKHRMRKVADMKTADEQYRYFLFNDVKVSPTMFFSRESALEVGGCDERIPHIQDYPLKLHFLKNGYRMGYLEATTVQYRIHNSISHRKDEICAVNHTKERRIMKKYCCYPYIPKIHIGYWLSEGLEWIQEEVIINFFHNRPSFGAKCFMKIMGYLTPRQWERRIVQWKSGK